MRAERFAIAVTLALIAACNQVGPELANGGGGSASPSGPPSATRSATQNPTANASPVGSPSNSPSATRTVIVPRTAEPTPRRFQAIPRDPREPLPTFMAYPGDPPGRPGGGCAPARSWNERVICGHVSDEKGASYPGVCVSVEQSYLPTNICCVATTDADGNYFITIIHEECVYVDVRFLVNGAVR